MEAEGNIRMALEPLQMVLVDGSLVDCMGFKGKEIMVKEVIADTEERRSWFEGKKDKGWEKKEFYDKLTAFSKFLGMPLWGGDSGDIEAYKGL